MADLRVPRGTQPLSRPASGPLTLPEAPAPRVAIAPTPAAPTAPARSLARTEPLSPLSTETAGALDSLDADGLLEDAALGVEAVDAATEAGGGMLARLRARTQRVAEAFEKDAPGGRIKGGALGAYSVYGGGREFVAGVDALLAGDADGAWGMASGALRVGEGGTEIFVAAFATTKVGGMARAVVVAETRVVPVLGFMSGSLQCVSALCETPSDYVGAGCGAVNAVASVCMAFPPLGSAIGGGLMLLTAVVENWDSITEAAGAVAEAVDDVADAVGDAFEDVGDFLGL